ncbi:hypothetical protein N7493_000508 [Penicillium malachiteum]|uniref:Uncharacterized protein n=1 Tax=Penicillium malachiteum TaxID=1324776 RepID=A0AAD6N0X6_9EURO|nr:hypothetical protein N7493_000508 [Penicillium malachiteum]
MAAAHRKEVSISSDAQMLLRKHIVPGHALARVLERDAGDGADDWWVNTGHHFYYLKLSTFWLENEKHGPKALEGLQVFQGM